MLLCLEFYLEEDVFYNDRDLQDTILQLFKTVKWFRMVRAEQLVNGISRRYVFNSCVRSQKRPSVVVFRCYIVTLIWYTYLVYMFIRLDYPC